MKLQILTCTLIKQMRLKPYRKLPHIFLSRCLIALKGHGVKFGPTIAGGLVDEAKPIECHDSDSESTSYYLEMEWDISGRAITDDLEGYVQN